MRIMVFRPVIGMMGADSNRAVFRLRTGKPADVCAEHLLGKARGLSQGYQRIYHAQVSASFIDMCRWSTKP